MSPVHERGPRRGHGAQRTHTHVAVGLALLLYDYALTFADEAGLIWPAPATYAKYMFLLNRYTVLGTLCAVAYGESRRCPCSRAACLSACVPVEMCGFAPTAFSDLVRPSPVSPVRVRLAHAI